tara:strand:+ start:2865 stop:4193 length:1329 start_codon:yes stop_codon:yes gene_type:complete
MFASALWMLAWWISNAVPIGITALLPIILFPMLGILDLKSTSANYAHPIIYLFLGGFMLGLAIEKWKLHKRIALNILKYSGEKPSKIVLGSMLATSLLSMWISNTATAIMMLPIGMSIIKLIGSKLHSKKEKQNFALSILLGIAYAANIGGIGTLIGTPPNLVLASLAEDSGLNGINFSSWFFFAIPLVIVLFSLCFILLSKIIFPLKSLKIEGMSLLIKQELENLGELSEGEKRVSIILIFTALCWVFRAQLNQIYFLENLSDTIIAIMTSIVLFALPSGKKSKPILVWEDSKKLPWEILLLFGGGLALAKGLSVSNIVLDIGTWISSNSGSAIFILIIVICAFSIFLTEVMSNVALVSVFIPVSFIVAEGFGLNGLQLAIPLTIGASCAFMFPISTPPNAVVFASGKIKMKDMAKAGFFLNLLCLILISLYCYWFQDFFF